MILNEEIGAEGGKEILIADDVETSVTKEMALLADIDLRKRIGERGRAFSRSRFSKEKIMNTLKGALAEISSSK